jgi:hypothetical protein
MRNSTALTRQKQKNKRLNLLTQATNNRNNIRRLTPEFPDEPPAGPELCLTREFRHRIRITQRKSLNLNTDIPGRTSGTAVSHSNPRIKSQTAKRLPGSQTEYLSRSRLTGFQNAIQ